MRTSKNDLFSTDWSVRPLPPPAPVKAPPSPIQKPGAEPAPPVAISKPSYPVLAPAITVSSDTGPATLAPSDALELRLLPGKELGHGRVASVHLAAYREAQRSPRQSLADISQAGSIQHALHRQSSSSSSSSSSSQQQPWRLCAAKMYTADKEAQVAGLSEALMLAKLAKCPQVLHFIGLKDETVPSRPSSASCSRSNSSTSAQDGERNELDEAAEERQAVVRPRLTQSQSYRERRLPSGGSLSTPSSPVIKANNPGSSIPPLLDLQHLQIRQESKSSLRRNATVKAPKTPSPLHIAKGRFDDTLEETPLPRLFLLTEYCPLENLATFTRQHGASLLGKRAFYKLAIDLLEALVATHSKNIIHGDVKPQNCMLDASFALKLGDYSSSLFDSADLTDGIGLGSTQYSAPEIVQMPPTRFSFPIDIFAAGLTLLFMITGVEPYESLAGATGRGETPATPLSPRSSRNASGAATPTSATKRKFRASSGAGKVVELHLHLSKGHAWEWEEKRRLDELEHDAYEHEDAHALGTDHEEDQRQALEIPSLACVLDGDYIEWPAETVHVPQDLLDPIPTQPITHDTVYSDSYTPVQTFLSGTTIVSEPLRDLLQAMLHPTASQRPAAAQVLHELRRQQAAM